ncbi:RecQ family ATP-dependent DNA helicase [Desulfogranum japonicum]|uniref:RecQ family ATP-dependent DNA helicase n=1 Tax=Desulfogranum japonicum TaxID=231447 RepID=UPI00041A8325|nr:RecQ family ATP-dependent DNA helicase [Desulfogranum japonicum]
MPMTTSRLFLDQCLLLDIEINENAEIYAIGAVFQGKQLCYDSRKIISSRQLHEIDALADQAGYVLGHNIIAHDIPQIAKANPHLNLLTKPVVDTLYLSPLAFPENPYHRLVKDYQLVRDSINNPAADAMLAGKVFAEQWEELSARQQIREQPLLYRSFLVQDAALAGTADALGEMGLPVYCGEELYTAFYSYAASHGCVTAAQTVIEELQQGMAEPAQLAYVCAWLGVAGGNSVLPPWVRYRYPQIGSLLHRLREIPCRQSECQYCQEHHDAVPFLKRYFGFPGFRETPTTEDGKSLQGEIVAAAASNASLFATLPTGGGKSLCYMLPAIMRYQRRNLLTIVISPLQALMKDQVDNFSQITGTQLAAAIYGALTMPERGAVQEGVRLGDVGILFISPEQLRNKSLISIISQREIGAWVFDEAHCLSKWGHDFRPDYLYAVRFIREFARETNTVIPPVQCFTATAKNDVRREIIDMMRSELGVKVLTFEGGHERSNLQYEVHLVTPHEKNQAIVELLKERYRSGSVVIYCASRKKTEQLAEFLMQDGYEAEAFHAGMDPVVKRRLQEDFIAGEVPIICATNAFGMGIDKDDVRLVIHADIPGSLENYLQEAGRAGRDRKQAECILVYAEQDIEGQFSLSAGSRLCKKEIAQLLQGIKSAARAKDLDKVVLTPGEILRLESVDIDPEQFGDPDTKIKAAIAWLERAGHLERKENNTRVFQGYPLVASLEEARQRLQGLHLSSRQQERWLAILAMMMEKRSSGGFSADEIASVTAFGQHKDDPETETEAQRVVRTLDDMARQGLVAKSTTLSAFVRYKVKDSSEKRLQRVCALEHTLLNTLRQAAPEADLETPLVIDLRQVNQQLINAGHPESTPQSLRLILYGLSRDGRGIAGKKGSVSVAATGNNTYSLRLHREWDVMVKTVNIRQQAARSALEAIVRTIPPDTRPGGKLLVDFTLEDVVDSLNRDLTLRSTLKDHLAAAERALTFMHEQAVIDLQHGLAVFRQSMTLVLNAEARRRQYTKTDFEPLATHYQEQNFQIHVMNEYARRALDKIGQAMNLIASYFRDDKADFIRRFFAGREHCLQLATTEQSYQKIVHDLHNQAQEKIVTEEAGSNMLVLAGPGSGKTRVVAHRVAYLLRVERVPARSILVLCFNRGAVQSLRKRIRELVGKDMRGVTAHTFHGLALRLTGRSLVPGEGEQRSKEIDYRLLIKQANALLKGEADSLGFEEHSARDILVGRYSHILVDEYQDIDEDQYELISLLSGKETCPEDLKLTLLAVGDDDQNIYTFRGADFTFIRRFQQDYPAVIHYLMENYRSSANILAAANQLIGLNRDRMKTEHDIVVNQARQILPKGGNWEHLDSLSRGRVQILQVSDAHDQAVAVVRELQRLQGLSDRFSLSETAILAREWQELDAIRGCLEGENIPVNLNWSRSSFPGLSHIREYRVFLNYLKQQRGEYLSAAHLLALLPEKNAQGNIWQDHLRQLLNDWKDDTGNRSQPVSSIEEYLYESLADQHRARGLGNGIFLSTVHSVKGLEFDHVFVLGGSWPQGDKQALEEERRLYYVAMTRARQTLQLMELQNQANPHTQVFTGEHVYRRAVKVMAGRQKLARRYAILGMEDLFLDFAGRFPDDHEIHTALGACRCGDALALSRRGNHLFLMDSQHTLLGRLSKAARDTWLPLHGTIQSVHILAMAQRQASDVVDEQFRKQCQAELWEIPICEIAYDAS